MHVHGHALEAHAAAAVGTSAETKRFNIGGDCCGIDALADGVGGQHFRVVDALRARANFFAPHVDIVTARVFVGMEIHIDKIATI